MSRCARSTIRLFDSGRRVVAGVIEVVLPSMTDFVHECWRRGRRRSAASARRRRRRPMPIVKRDARRRMLLRSMILRRAASSQSPTGNQVRLNSLHPGPVSKEVPPSGYVPYFLNGEGNWRPRVPCNSLNEQELGTSGTLQFLKDGA